MTLPLRFLAALAVVVLALLPTTVVATPQPADGCGELALTDRDAVGARGEQADDVFVGRITDITLDEVPVDGSASDLATPTRGTVLQVQVQQVLAGDNRAERKPVDVLLTPANAKLDPQLRKLGRYLFFTTGTGREVRADACEGFVAAPQLEKGRLDPATVAQLQEFLAAPTKAAPVDLGAPPDDADDTPALGRLVAPGGAISLIGILGLLLIGRISRTAR